MIYSIEEYNEANETKLINDFISSKDRKELLRLKQYACGDNPFINDRLKKIYVEDLGLVENPYVPNYQSKYGFYNQVITQKVNALTSEMPLIENVDDNTRKYMGFATKRASYIASMQGYSFTFVGVQNQFIVFDTENVLAYADEKGNLKVLLRFWQTTIKNKTVTYYERYNDKGMQTFKYSVLSKKEEVHKLIPYKVKVRKSQISTDYIIDDIDVIPIIILKNNDQMLPDMTPAIRSKIDLIDLIESDLYNNIQEFSDIWLSISADVDIDTAKKIKENIRKTKLMVAKEGELTAQTVQIPYEARQVAINILKQELIEDGGIIDFKEIKGNATATEINARTYKLVQKVSDFEWYVDEYLTSVVKLWQLYVNKNFDVNITFQKLFIKNNLETVNIANSVADRISQKSYLKLLQQANVIDSVEDEILEIEKESLLKFDVGEINGQDTQTNGQEFTSNEQTNTTNISE